jgi:hypothetical protein
LYKSTREPWFEEAVLKKSPRDVVAMAGRIYLSVISEILSGIDSPTLR